MPCVLKLIDSDKKKYDINIEFGRPYKIYNGYNKTFEKGILSNYMLNLDEYKGEYDKKDILSVEICNCIKEVPESIPYEIPNAKGLIIPSSIPVGNFSPKALVNLQGTALECVCIENNPGVEKLLRDSFPNLKIFHKRDEYNAFLFNEQTLKPAYLEVKDTDNKIHKLEIYDDDFKDEESNYIFPRLRHLHAFKIEEIFKRNGLNPKSIKTINCYNIRNLGALCFNKFENLISVGFDKSLDNFQFSPFPDCLIGLKLPNSMHFGFYERNNNNSDILKKIKCVLVEKGSKIEKYVCDKWPNLKIFYDKNEYDKFIENQSQSQKGFIKITDLNGKTYEHEFEFSNHEELQKKYLKEDRRLTADLLDKILNDCELKKNNIKKVELRNVKAIGSSTFSQCSNLEDIKLPYGIKELSCSSFLSCEKLQNIDLPKSLKRIDVAVFNFCDLRSIVIPKGLIISESTFTNNKNLSDITIIENPEAEKKIKRAKELGAISKSVKIFHSLKERDDFYRANKNENPEVYMNYNSDENVSSLETETCDSESHNSKPKQEINNQETKIQKRSYSELISFKLLIPLYNIIWIVYTLICIANQNKTNEKIKKPISNTKLFNKQNKFPLTTKNQINLNQIPQMQKNNHKNRFIGF